MKQNEAKRNDFPSSGVDLTIPEDVRVLELKELDVDYMKKLACTPGLCYLNLFRPDYRNVVFQGLGVSPTWRDLHLYVVSCVGTPALYFEVMPYLQVLDIDGEWFAIKFNECGDYDDGRQLLVRVLFPDSVFVDDEQDRCVGNPDFAMCGMFDDAWKVTVHLEAAPREVPVNLEVEEAIRVAPVEKDAHLPVRVRVDGDVSDSGWPPEIVEYARTVVERYGVSDLAECAPSADGKGFHAGPMGYPFPYDLARRDGYCYLKLFAIVARPRIAMALGAYPSIRDVYQLYVAALVFSFMGRNAVSIERVKSLCHLQEADQGDWKKTLIMLASHCLSEATHKMGGTKFVTVVEPEPSAKDDRAKKRRGAMGNGYWIAYTGVDTGGADLNGVTRLRRDTRYAFSSPDPFVLELHEGSSAVLPGGLCVRAGPVGIFVLCKNFIRVHVGSVGPLGVRITPYGPKSRGALWFTTTKSRVASTLADWWVFAGPRVTEEMPKLEPIKGTCWHQLARDLEDYAQGGGAIGEKVECACATRSWRARDVPYTVAPGIVGLAYMFDIQQDIYIGGLFVPKGLGLCCSVTGLPVRPVEGVGPLGWSVLSVDDCEYIDGYVSD